MSQHPLSSQQLSQWLDDFLPGLSLNAGGVAEFVGRDGLSCLLCHDAETGRLHFVATLLHPEPAQFPALALAALRLNWLQQDSDGGALACDEAAIALHYCLRIDLDGIGRDRLHGRLDRAIATARRLAAALRADAAEARLPDFAAKAPETDANALLRV